MVWVDAAGWMSWIIAYALAVYAAEQHGKTVWRHAVPAVGLPVGLIGYLAIAWIYGRWPVLIVGVVLMVIAIGVVLWAAGRRAPTVSQVSTEKQ